MSLPGPPEPDERPGWGLLVYLAVALAIGVAFMKLAYG
jgi:hypothetical protein